MSLLYRAYTRPPPCSLLYVTRVLLPIGCNPEAGTVIRSNHLWVPLSYPAQWEIVVGLAGHTICTLWKFTVLRDVKIFYIYKNTFLSEVRDKGPASSVKT